MTNSNKWKSDDMVCPLRAKCFIMQPFGKKTSSVTGELIDNEAVYKSLKGLEKIRPDFPIEVYRADTITYKDEELHKHIVRCISESHFCIADLTGQNVNVLYETGYARGMHREVVVICQNRNDIPTDLKGLITVPPYRMDDLNHLPNDIEQHFDRIEKAVAYLRSEHDTHVQYFSKRDDSLIRKKMRDAKESIDILQTNLSIIQANYITELIETMRNNKDLKLRILTLNPQSIFVNFRGNQLGYPDNIALYRGELEASLKTVSHNLLEFKDRVSIRIYDDFPTQIVFNFDEEILTCVVSATGRSRYNCAFLLNSGMPGAIKSFIEHFKYLWEKKSVAYSITV